MNYLIYGQERYLITEKIKELSENYQSVAINKFDYESKEFSFDDFLIKVNSIDFFESKKLFIIENCSFLTSTGKISEYDIKNLEQYFENVNEDIEILFVYKNKGTEKLDSRKKIYKLFVKYLRVLNFEGISNQNFNTFYLELLNKYQLDLSREIKEYLANRLPLDLFVMNNELMKLSLYDDKIDKTVIDALIAPLYNENIFALVDAMVYKMSSKKIKVLNDLFASDNDPIALMYSLASQFRFMFKVKVLMNKGYDQNKIINTLKQKPYYIETTMKKCYKLTTQEILRFNKGLSDLDYLFKTDTNINKKDVLTLFILEENM